MNTIRSQVVLDRLGQPSAGEGVDQANFRWAPFQSISARPKALLPRRYRDDLATQQDSGARRRGDRSGSRIDTRRPDPALASMRVPALVRTAGPDQPAGNAREDLRPEGSGPGRYRIGQTPRRRRESPCFRDTASSEGVFRIHGFYSGTGWDDQSHGSRRTALLVWLHACSACSLPGEFALRGEVLDVFMPGDDQAYRVVFDYERIAKISRFDPGLQSGTGTFRKLALYPMKEVVWDNTCIEALGAVMPALHGCADRTRATIEHLLEHRDFRGEELRIRWFSKNRIPLSIIWDRTV